MFRLLERYQTWIVLFAIIVFPLLVYRANSTEPADTNIVDRLVLAATEPLKKLMSDAIGAVSDTWFEYVDVRGARRENGELRRRVGLAEAELDRLRALELENTHLRGLLKIKDDNPKIAPIAATVIAVGSSPLSRTIEIDRGAIDGIARGMSVVSDEGLVGSVMRVGWTSAEVILISDEKMLTWGRVVRSRARGRVKGRGAGPDFGLELTEVLRSDDVQVGDRIATSGLGGVFPAGIPIGEVTEVRTPTGAQHRVADVEPYVDFARLEHVAVIASSLREDDPLVMPDPLRPAVLRTGAPERSELAVDAGVPGEPAAGVRDAGPRAKSDAGVRTDRDAAIPTDLPPESAPPDARAQETPVETATTTTATMGATP